MLTLQRSILAAVGGAVLLSASLLTTATPVQGHESGSTLTALTPKSLVIGVDGATYYKFAAAGLTKIPALQQSGMTSLSNLYANPMAPTYSGPGWSTIGHGVWPDKHNVKDNSFSGNRFSQYPDYLTRIETATPSRSTLVVGNWDPISTTVFSSAVDSRVDEPDDAATTAAAVSRLSTGNPDSTFVHLDEVDHTGHAYGAASSQYAQALRDADQRVGQLVAAVQGRSTYSQESWLIVVTCDHGHTDAGGHGGNSPQERQVFVIARGPGIAANTVRYDVKSVDIAASVLTHHGISQPSSWGLDGAAFGAITPDAFDAQRSVLQTRVDETGIPSTVLGWTHTAPSGWSIDNSALPSGGVTEWRGWAFATDEFWSNSQLGQNRETSVRNRNVFAVADSDEWDDKSHGTGQFDSTLVSPSYDVTGRASVVLRYATNYHIDGPQSATIYAVWNGGTPVSVKSYTVDTNKAEALTLTVPSGATSLRLRFRYTGTNSAFWTIDQVRVS